MSISMIGLDTAKSVFQGSTVQVNETRKAGDQAAELRRSELSSFFEKQESWASVTR